jgi:hypothetical protein
MHEFGMQLTSNPSTRSSSIERLACASPRQWLYLFGEEGGVVYSEALNRFAGLDAAGVAAFLAFDAHIPMEGGEAARFAQNRNASPAPPGAMESIHALAGGVFPAADPSEEWPAFNPHADSHLARVHLSGAHLEIAGVPMSIEYPAGPLESLCGNYFQNCRPAVLPPRCHLSAQSMEDGWAILVNGRIFLSIDREEQLGLGLMHAARHALYQLGTYDVAFHAAMIARGECGLLLCAPRESGKSTLAAHLAATGFDFLADEPALLRLDTGSIQSTPLPISLKEGSWAHLQQQWPQIAAAPVHLRSDGVQIRLLHLPEERISARPRRLTHMAFPQYIPSSTARPQRLSPLRALCLLNTAGMLFAQGSTREQFEAFLDLVCSIPAFTFPFSSLAEAGQALHALCEIEECDGRAAPAAL